MLHDTPNIGSKKFFDAATEILKVFKKRFEDAFATNNQKIVISISGESGSGKSTISYQLSKKLMSEFRGVRKNINVKHLYVDNFYIENHRMDRSSKRGERISARGYTGIGPDEYDWPMIYDVLHCFANGHVCRMPCIDVLNQQLDFLETNFSDVNVLVLDGLYAIDERLQSDFRFLIDGTYYQINNLEDIRQKYIHGFDTMEGLHEYALAVTSITNSVLHQDIRSKEKFTEDRVIRLEKEHEALQKMIDAIKNKNYNFSTLKYINDNWVIE
ncbi:MAG: hypothetical protein KAJ62_08135 [Desulfobacteraceae bacterium]|nr:hypothetical protein [Desulfobacteraceae bacterium]